MSDFCYSRRMLHRVLQQTELMDRMMARLGVDLATAARLEKGMAWYKARRHCIACHSDRQCREWLKRTPAEPSDGSPDFCGNSAFFGRCELNAPGPLTLDGGAQ
jgi:hypothetical protein